MPTFPRALLPALLASLALQACRLSPEGSCDTDGDCQGGRHCAENVCVPDGRSDLYAGCVVDRDCDPFAKCSRGVCVLLPGRCAVPVDCAPWESCDESVCRPLPGRCGTLEDCAPWEICIAAASTSPPLPERRCAVAPGRCTDASHCATWQVCAATRFCETGPGLCAGAADCEAWEVCGGDNRCAVAPGRCGDDSGCEAWQVCAAGNTCETGPGFCADDAGCDAWKACGTDNVCALRAGACDVQDDCAPELVCEANACVAQPPPPALDPAAVHLVGTLEPGTPGRGAITPLGTPYEKLVGLADGDAACGARLAPDGSVVLSRASALRTLVPDAIVWDSTTDLWIYPPAPATNDTAVALPAGCASAAGLVLQAGTGALLVDCGVPGLPAWTGADGAVVTTEPLLAWNADGLKLAGAEGSVLPPVLLDATGAPVNVTGFPVDGTTGLPTQLLAGWRASLGGFSLVVTAGTELQLVDLEVWALDATGAATLVGALPPLPTTPTVTELDPPVLDAAGNVYQLGRTAGGDVVVRRTPGATEATVVHDEAALPPAGAAATLLDERVHAVDACLLTGP